MPLPSSVELPEVLDSVQAKELASRLRSSRVGELLADVNALGGLGAFAKEFGRQLPGAAKQAVQSFASELNPFQAGVAYAPSQGGKLTDPRQRISGAAGGLVAAAALVAPVPGGKAKRAEGVTLKTLNRLVGKEEVSKQFVQDLSNMADLKQPERDLVRKALNEVRSQKVKMSEFMNRVKSDLLPLKEAKFGRTSIYEGVTLTKELRGPINDYYERVYESPIRTYAGKKHFGQGEGDEFPNYFAHTRVEDIPKTIPQEGGKYLDYFDNAGQRKKGDTRRIIELQSDLFQKGELERQFRPLRNVDEGLLIENAERRGMSADEIERMLDDVRKTQSTLKGPASDNYKKLEPYRNIWHERVIREEVKKAAEDGKKKLQLPTGETAMRVEGLGGEAGGWVPMSRVGRIDELFGRGGFDEVKELFLKPEELKSGLPVKMVGQFEEWIITEVVEGGRFKAMPRSAIPKGKSLRSVLNNPEIRRRYEEGPFDPQNKFDTSHPIYRFYEKEVGRYVTNKYQAKRVVDPQGVSWWEINVPEELGRLPVEAFGVAPLMFHRKEEESNKPKGGGPELPESIPASQARSLISQLQSGGLSTGGLFSGTGSLPDVIPVGQARSLVVTLMQLGPPPVRQAVAVEPQPAITEPEPLPSPSVFPTKGNLGTPIKPTELPIKGRITQGFGVPQAVKDAGERIHHGVDIAVPSGTPVPEVKGGTVISASREGAFGNSVVVLGRDGLVRRYSHLARVSVRPGESVSAGDLIGVVGSTGVSTGNHLDFRVYQPAS